MMNKQLEEETEEKKWNNYSIEKKMNHKKLSERIFFIDYKERIAEGKVLFPHEDAHYVSKYLLKESKPIKTTKVVSPKHRDNDLKSKVFFQALKNSFLYGEIPIEEYNKLKKDNELVNRFMPLRVNSQMQSRRENALFENHKVQRRMKQLLKFKRRRLSTANAMPTNTQSKTNINYKLRSGSVIKETSHCKHKYKL